MSWETETRLDGRLAWCVTKPENKPKAWVAIVHGYGEHIGRYQHTMRGLAERDLASVAVDLRGHGNSTGAPTDIAHFEDYFKDVDVLWAKTEELAQGAPRFILAHSLGGLIATLWAARGPRGLKGLVLSSPFYALAGAPPRLKVAFARVLRRIAPGLRLGNGLDISMLSRDEAWCRSTAADPLYRRTTTPRWYFEVVAAQGQVEQLAPSVVAPVLMLIAGGDRIVSPSASQRVFELLGSAEKQLRNFDNAPHEILNDFEQEKARAEIAAWILLHS